MPADPAGAAGLAAGVVGLTHVYGRTAALDDVSLSVPSACLAGLIGPDGVGKSTLLALIAGVREIQTGEVRALGGDMDDSIHRSLSHRRIAYMPQGLGRNLYPTLSVFENLDFFGRLFGQDKAERETRIRELLKATGLDPFPDRPAGKLSGGMKQKLALCCALIHDPDLLILDEPTTGVDPLSRRQFWELIDRMRARRPGMSVIVATAYMEEADRFDWLAAMNGGRVIGVGTPAEIKERAGKATLEEAFISLLPEKLRAAHHAVIVPPRSGDGGVPAIEARGLTRRFAGFVAVDRVNFSIGRGEIFGFIGSNGCGKTTTMKMMTGLLPASEGQALLFGQPLDARDMETRRRVGYVSQSFSLYAELTVLQNLVLHAQLFGLPPDEIEGRVAEMLKSFDLVEYAASGPDQFWRYLIDLSRRQRVTIFISTHFMNEAERCDRVSLMHAGRVLAVGAPRELAERRGAATLEDAFVSYLREASGDGAVASAEEADPPARVFSDADRHSPFFDPRRLWAYARRETMEIVRDPIRLTFAILGPVILMLAFGYGISFDVEDLPYAVYDQDQSLESRSLMRAFEGSYYFTERPAAASSGELHQRLKNGELMLGVDIPAGFGRDLMRGRRPEVEVLVDGAMPFRAETALGYVSGMAQQYLAEQTHTQSAQRYEVVPRMVYNQAFKSANAIIPSVITLVLILIPAMMTAVGVVREKEYGSISNFRSTSVTRFEFLIGKQAPYVAIAYFNFLTLVLLAVFLLDVPIRGSVPTLFLGAALYVASTTGFGILVSTFTNTQVSAMFATAVIALIPAVNFSGLLVPVSSLSGQGRIIGLSFPSGWFQQVSVGSFTKGLGFADLGASLSMLVFFAVIYTVVARFFLKKREA